MSKNSKEKRLTRQDLANLIGTSKTNISRIENDKIEREFSALYKIYEVC